MRASVSGIADALSMKTISTFSRKPLIYFEVAVMAVVYITSATVSYGGQIHSLIRDDRG
jgi:hypothetical protein